ncbi:MAG: hypothetical protein R3D59_17385 [Paracoccaceae bacterium]
MALFGERLDGWTVAGMVLIVATGVFAPLPGRRHGAGVTQPAAAAV